MAEKFSKPQGYERYLGPWSAALARPFLDFAGVKDGDRVLDVGSGTGSLACALATTRPRSEVVGIDPSAPYVQFAVTRIKDSRVRFQVGDAMNLPYVNSSFDKSLAQLVVSSIPDPFRAALEMRRVTKSGGTLAACVWASGKDNERNWMFWEAAMAVDPAAAEWCETGGRYGRTGGLVSLWTDCGLKEIEESALVVSVEFGSFEDFWLPHLEGQGRAGSYVRSLPPDRQEALRERLRRDLLGARPDGPFSLRAQAVAVRGIC
ncbi:MAG TPA: methyltransferase domain-containing protein [Candidatus Binatia bacterium]|nr:methyltransferase domain-containing protein [Candidatus Binatia bacterium]